MHSVIETQVYLADASAAGMTEDDRARVVTLVSRDPKAGEVIVGTGGARKVRVAGRGKGKSGGYRVFTFYAAADVPVFLLTVLSKGQRDNLSATERNGLRIILADLASDYREGVRRKVVALPPDT